VPVIDPATGVIHPAQIFVAVLGASNLTFAYASYSQKLADWIDGQTRALTFYGGVTKAIVCDNLKSAVAKALWFEPTLTATFAAFAEHYDTSILPARPRNRLVAPLSSPVLAISSAWPSTPNSIPRSVGPHSSR
jgi:transposase